MREEGGETYTSTGKLQVHGDRISFIHFDYIQLWSLLLDLPLLCPLFICLIFVEIYIYEYGNARKR